MALISSPAADCPITLRDAEACDRVHGKLPFAGDAKRNMPAMGSQIVGTLATIFKRSTHPGLLQTI